MGKGGATTDQGPARVYVIRDISRAMRWCDRTTRRKIDQGLIPGCFRVGRSVRFHADAIDEWINNGCPRPWSR